MRHKFSNAGYIITIVSTLLLLTQPSMAQKVQTPSADAVAAKTKVTPVKKAAPVKRRVEKGIINESPLPARKLFGYIQAPAPMKARSYGGYAKGCIGGAVPLDVDGSAWQVMRLSRNRNWGHPSLIRFLKKLATDVQQKDDWPGLLIGDMSQPRGGPMLTGHKSHQLGLDADIWMMGMPNRRLSYKEREQTAATSMLSGKISINHTAFKAGNVRVLKRAASAPEVARIFVHPAIKQAVCEATKDDPTRAKWLKKIRPWWGHHYHFHVRLKCPKGNRGCHNQNPVPAGDGCGKPIKDWFAMMTRPKPKPKPKKKDAKDKPKKPKKRRKKRYLTLASLPRSCRQVLSFGRHKKAMLFAKGANKIFTLPQAKPVQ